MFSNIFIVPPTLIFNGKARGAIYNFYRKDMRLSRWRSVYFTYKNHCDFAQVVIDRFAMYAGKKFDFEFEGFEHFKRLSELHDGFIQLSAHMGNYELVGYSLVSENKRVNALVFGGEKGSIMENRNRLFDKNNIRMIAVAEDMSHLFEIDKALADGEIVSMPADRIFGSSKYFPVKMLGKDAKLPQGPFILASVRDLPILSVFVMKRSYKLYKVVIKPLAVERTGSTRMRAQLLASQYANQIESILSEYPTQWYNYFDFFKD